MTWAEWFDIVDYVSTRPHLSNFRLYSPILSIFNQNLVPDGNSIPAIEKDAFRADIKIEIRDAAKDHIEHFLEYKCHKKINTAYTVYNLEPDPDPESKNVKSIQIHWTMNILHA